MFKRMTVFLLILALASVAFAADPAVTGKITSIGDGQVTISLDGDRPAWLKKNAPVKFATGAVGKVLEVTDATPVVIVVKSKKASAMTVGSEVSIKKGKAMAGC